MQEKICIHSFISGHVQGVWFRASAQQEAERLNITGWVRNLPDGRVEVIAAGEKDKVTELHTWLQQGPPKAKVIEATYEEIEWQDHSRFALK